MSARNYAVDVLKFFCALLVVFIHVDFNYSKYFLPITRCAVPIFLIISGYFLYDKNGGGYKQEKLSKNIRHIAKLALWSTLFFFVYLNALTMVEGGAIIIPNKGIFFKWLFFNDTIFGNHLWYLFAYLYVLFTVFFANKIGKVNGLFYLLPLLLLANLLLGMYSKLVLGMQLPYYFVRNFLLLALPFFLMGSLIKRYEDKILSVIKTPYLIIGVVLCGVLTYVEKNILESAGVLWGGNDLFLSSVFLAVFFLLLTLSLKNPHNSWMAKIGEKDSLYIYVFHPVVAFFCSFICHKLNIQNLYLEVAPFIVIIITILLIEICGFLVRKINVIK